MGWGNREYNSAYEMFYSFIEDMNSREPSISVREELKANGIRFKYSEVYSMQEIKQNILEQLRRQKNLTCYYKTHYTSLLAVDEIFEILKDHGYTLWFTMHIVFNSVFKDLDIGIIKGWEPIWDDLEDNWVAIQGFILSQLKIVEDDHVFKGFNI